MRVTNEHVVQWVDLLQVSSIQFTCCELSFTVAIKAAVAADLEWFSTALARKVLQSVVFVYPSV